MRSPAEIPGDHPGQAPDLRPRSRLPLIAGRSCPGACGDPRLDEDRGPGIPSR
ncbi:MAG: hypothetical protein MZU84_05930 [Sphingobacterium sp.]|nr:hypothetical protein [Sphingobacterium sp.]